MVKFAHIIFLFIIIVIGDILALIFGLYDKTTWMDLAMHFLAGILFGTAWLWIISLSFFKNKIGVPPKFYIALLTVMVALVGSFLWELFEFSISSFLPEIAGLLRLYSRPASDLLSDMAFGLLGGLSVAIFFAVKHG